MESHNTIWICFLMLLLPLGISAQDNMKIKDEFGTVLMEVREDGILVRKMTTTERTAISGLDSDDNGLLVYDTDTKSLWLWKDGTWVEIDGIDLVDDADSDPTNELDTWLTLPGIPAGFADGIDDVNDADSDPTNELDTWSTLPGIPSGFSDGTDDVNDADSDPTNELDTWSTLPGIPAGFTDGTDDVNDADSDPTNELQTWATLPGIPADFTDGIDHVNDADSDPLNEKNISLLRNGTLVELTDAGGMLSTNVGWAIAAGKVFNTTDNIGIGTSTTPARFNVQNGAVLFDGTIGATPVSGIGARMMWVPSKQAFRAGFVNSTQWDDTNIGLRSFVGGGTDNLASGQNGFVGGGTLNTASGFASFASGRENTASGINAMAGGGFSNIASGVRAFTGGGMLAEAIADNSFVGGGFDNTSSGNDAFVGGGVLNIASGGSSFVGGGYTNTATSGSSAVVGGNFSSASGINAFVGGGAENNASGAHSFVGGGNGNRATGYNSFVAGGGLDSAIADGTFVGGGYNNTASGINASSNGGENNTSSGNDAFVGGGNYNIASGVVSFVGGGYQNVATGLRSSIAGGMNASATADNSFVGGGFGNTSSGNDAFVAGGVLNIASGGGSFVGGGYQNSATGVRSFIAGGMNASATADNSFVGGGFDNTSSGNDAFIAGGVTNIASGNTSFVAGGLSNTASGYASFATGRESTASGNHAFAAGYGLLSKSFNEAVIGTYNADYTPASTDGYNNSDRLFSIGNGTSNATRSNAMTILKDGKVGMGTTSPQAGLHVVGDKGLGEHIMLIENTNHEGSGLKIKIAGSHPLWVQGEGENPDFFITRPVSALETIFEDVGGDIRDYLLSEEGFTLSNLDLANIGSPAGLIDQLGLTDFLAGGVCKGISNLVDFTNTTFLQPIQLPDLPLDGIPSSIPDFPSIPEIPTIAPFTINIPDPQVCISFLDIGCWGISIPPVNVPLTNINNSIGNFNTSIGTANSSINTVNTTLDSGYDKLKNGITAIDNLEIPLPQLQMPESIGFIDCPNPNPWDNFDIAFERLNPLDYNILNPLSNDNHFITFVDSYDNRLGAITGQSIGEFNLDYFKLEKVIEIGSYVVGLFSVDANILKNVMKLAKEGINFYKAANKMGVEYSSGHGDYAEWLERADHAETIGYGDIVGIRGGKVSLSLEEAEQVMVVSKAPIVRGNIPDPENETNGNNIAFIGQVPVKVMGPVSTGDFIIANPETPGYGVAVSENEITPDQLALAVGRSWETNLGLGFKFVNTIVGMHNSGWAAPVTKLQQRIESNEAAIQMLTARLDLLENSTSVAEGNKKSRL